MKLITEAYFTSKTYGFKLIRYTIYRTKYGKYKLHTKEMKQKGSSIYVVSIIDVQLVCCVLVN